MMGKIEIVRGKYLDNQILLPDVVTDGTKRYEVPEKWRPANIVRL